uniref:Uncharacterized protein n=1 Tax=Anguilla anguilla TaxID=7936 RepID=A0A0E9SQL5_ANGAN
MNASDHELEVFSCLTIQALHILLRH